MNTDETKTCPGCGRLVTVHRSREGTGFYLPVEDDDGEFCQICGGGDAPPEAA